jgi:hypothetical protein
VLALDHLVVVAPTLAEGVAHVRSCIDLDVPFGQRHPYMGSHNHLLQLGDSVYLEIVAVDPNGERPSRSRWFGLDDEKAVKADWDAGRRLRGWVARTDGIAVVLADREHVLGRRVSLPWAEPSFDFAITDDGALPFGGAAPCIIDRRGKARSMAVIPDLGARLVSFSIAHPDSTAVEALYRELAVDRPPVVVPGGDLRYHARVQTAAGVKELF